MDHPTIWIVNKKILDSTFGNTGVCQVYQLYVEIFYVAEGEVADFPISSQGELFKWYFPFYFPVVVILDLDNSKFHSKINNFWSF